LASGTAPLNQPAQSLLLACKAATDLLNIAPQLKIARTTCLKTIIPNLTIVDPMLTVVGSLVTQLERLDTQLDTLEAEISAASADPTKQLSRSVQYLNNWLQYQGAVAAIYGWDLYEAAYPGIRSLASLASYANWSAARAREIRASCVQLQTESTAIRQAINNVSSTDLALASARELQDVAALMDQGFAFFGRTDGPVSPALLNAAAALTAAGQFLARLQQNVKELASNVKEIEQIIAQLPELLKRIPEAISVELSLDWHPNIRSFEPVFRLEEGADLVIKASTVISLAQAASPRYDISATLKNFSINLIGEPSFIIVSIKNLQFTSVNGSKPNCKLEIAKVTFGSAMAYVEKLASLLDPGDGPFLEFADGMLNAGYRFQVPSIIVGAFSMMQLRLEISIGLPFNGDPIRCYFGISDSGNPFLLSAGVYGGSGYLLMRLGLDGVERLEGSLGFGVVAIVKIGPLRGYGEVVAGIHFAVGSGSSEVCGYVQAHGHCDIFGIVSLDVNVHVDMCYINGSVQGEADFSVDIEMLFFSVSYTFTASYTFAGSPAMQTSLLRRNGSELAALERPSLPFAPAVGGPPIYFPSVSPGTVIDNNRINTKTWRDYFDSFDTFPSEVHA
jgi:hypothetical protein